MPQVITKVGGDPEVAVDETSGDGSAGTGTKASKASKESPKIVNAPASAAAFSAPRPTLSYEPKGNISAWEVAMCLDIMGKFFAGQGLAKDVLEERYPPNVLRHFAWRMQRPQSPPSGDKDGQV